MKLRKGFMLRAVALALLLCLTATAAVAETAKVTGGRLRLRTAPSYAADTIDFYADGTKVTVLEHAGAWFRVRTPDGSVGYMRSKYLYTGTADTSTTTGETAYVTSANGKSVNLRAEASTNAAILASYKVGTKVTVISEGNGWRKVRVGTKTGYMKTQFLTGQKTSVPTGTSTVQRTTTVTSSNGKNVRLRASGSKNGRIIAEYPVGTKVNVLKAGKTWSWVSIGNQVGYMMTKFLK